MEQTFFLDAIWHNEEGFEMAPCRRKSTFQEETATDIIFSQTSRETWPVVESEKSFLIPTTLLLDKMESDPFVSIREKTTEIDFSQTSRKMVPFRPVRIVCVPKPGTEDLSPLTYQQRKIGREADLNFPAFLRGSRAKIKIVSSFLDGATLKEKKKHLEARLNSEAWSEDLDEHEHDATSKRSTTRESSARPKKRARLTETPAEATDASSCSDDEPRSSAGKEKQVKIGRTKKLSRLKRKYYGTAKVLVEKAGTAVPEDGRKPKAKSSRTEGPRGIDTADYRSIPGFKISKRQSAV